MRKPCALDVTLRGDPYALRDTVNRIRRALAAANKSVSGTVASPHLTASCCSEHAARSTPACAAAKRCRGFLHGIARDKQTGAGEGAGVKAGPVGVGLHEVYARRCGAEYAGRDLHVR